MKILVCFLFFTLLLSLSTSADTTLRYTDGGNVTQDDEIDPDNPDNTDNDDDWATSFSSNNNGIIALIELNLSGVPASSDITESLIDFYLDANNLNSDETLNISMHYIFDSWEENSVTWNTRPDFDGSANSQSWLLFDEDNTSGFRNYTFNITGFVEDELAKGNISLNLVLISNISEGSPSGIGTIEFRSKEHLTTANRPKWHINYLPSPCACPASGDWIVAGSDSCAISVPCEMDVSSSFVCSGAGTFTVTADITGWNSFEFNSGCNLHCDGGCFT